MDQAVQEKTGLAEYGTALMHKVFSEKRPLLAFENRDGIQLGYMYLYAGAFLAIRNPIDHSISNRPEPDLLEAMEILSFISWLFRELDGATLAATAR